MWRVLARSIGDVGTFFGSRLHVGRLQVVAEAIAGGVVEMAMAV